MIVKYKPSERDIRLNEVKDALQKKKSMRAVGSDAIPN